MAEPATRDIIQPGSKELFNSSDALNKFMVAGEIASNAMKRLIGLCVPGANIEKLCGESDLHIKEAVKKAYASAKGIRKGISLPTCISVNEILGHFAPLEGHDEDPVTLKEGDMVKLDLGVHIDGFPAWLGTTIMCGKDGEFTGRQADVMMAAWTAAEAGVRSLKSGNSNSDVTKMLEKSYESFDCRGIQGVLMHECGRNLVDGENIIQNRETAGEKVPEFQFSDFQVFMVDAFASTGTGKTKETNYRTTLYKRDHDNYHPMPTPATRSFYSHMMTNNPYFLYNVREISDKAARTMGVSECLRHYLIQKFPVVSEAPGAFTAKFTFPVVILPSGPKRICVSPPDLSKIKSDKEVTDEDLKQLLSQPYPPPKAPKTPKTAAVAEAAETPDVKKADA